MISWRVTASESDVIVRALRMGAHAGLPLAASLADDLEEKAREDRGETVRLRTD